jgi:dTDP-glucose 4,6-dehydratase
VKRIASTDLDHVLSHTESLWQDLKHQRLFITGGTGFFGKWLLETFLWANQRLSLQATATVLTRDPESFAREVPHLAADPNLIFHRGDVRTFEFPEGGFSHIIHAAATSATATFNNEQSLEKFDNVVSGTRRVLDFAVTAGTGKLLYTSSGPVYGPQPPEITHMPEEYPGAADPIDPKSAWGIGKRAAEFLCACYSEKYGISIPIARCYTFVGPHLQLDIHYAIGNFIQSALRNEPIVIRGDGTPIRSYLYASDLMIWLWTMLFKVKGCRAYNVGSEHPVSIVDLGRLVAQSVTPPLPVSILGISLPGIPANHYVPSTHRAAEELSLQQYVLLEEAIRKTLEFERL